MNGELVLMVRQVSYVGDGNAGVVFPLKPQLPMKTFPELAFKI